ncbi:MAG: hypothetical protein J6X93_05430 [Bacilli bacterium]|nr:hypothetical protein [Bacilli bacterium]
MKVLFLEEEIEEICTDFRKAKKYFGGSDILARSLLGRINYMQNADCLIDVIKMPQFRFHKLINKGKGKNLEGLFAVDVKTKIDKWRIIIEPLDDDELPFDNVRIDELAKKIRIIEVKEVSNHYE